MSRDHRDDPRIPHRTRENAVRPLPVLWQEAALGAAVGCCACFVIAWGLGGGAVTALLAGLVGVSAGAVVGVLLWMGAATFPTDPAVPRTSEEERDPRRPRR